MRKFTFYLICLLHMMALNAQDYADSLTNALSRTSNTAEAKKIKLLLGEYLVQREPEQAEAFANEVLEMPNTPTDSTEWARINYILAASHRWQGNYATALEYYHQNHQYFTRNTDSLEIARSAAKIGSINTFLGNNILAQQFLLQTSAIYEKLGTPLQKASIHNALAGFYLNLDQLEKGREKYLKALDEFTLLQDSAGMASANANLGYVYSQLGNYELAERHLMAQKALNAVFPTLREMGFHHDFMGLLRQKQGQLEEAYQQHLMALNIRKNLSSTYNLCESRLNVGDVLIQLGRYEEAIEQLQDVLTYKEHNSLNQQNAAHELLAEAYQQQGNYREALAHYKDFKATADSIYNEKSIQIIAEKDAQYQKKEQDAEIEILNREKTIAYQEARRFRMMLIGGVIVLFLFSLLSFFIYRLYKRVKHQNGLISETLHEKETLLREIHHRVKNNLQVISSLLSLQSRYIADSAAQEAVSEGQNRVKSMALIHQKLYQDSNLMGVEALDYIQSLTETLKSSYNVTGDKVTINYDVDQLNIDVDTIIPIGLILNELISNAFKHAFKDTNDSTLSISLKKADDKLALCVRDNGVGTPEDVKTSESFGMRMIQSLARKLEAEVDFRSNNGAEASIFISNFKLV